MKPWSYFQIECLSTIFCRLSLTIECLSTVLCRLSLTIECLSTVLCRLSLTIECLSTILCRLSLTIECLSTILCRLSFTSKTPMSHLCHLLKISVKPWNSNLSTSRHFSNMCKAAYIQIRHISSIRHLLTTQATQTLVCCLVLSRLDYCNSVSLLSGCPQYLVDKLQQVQNAAARFVCKAKKSDHIHPILETLHFQ